MSPALLVDLLGELMTQQFRSWFAQLPSPTAMVAGFAIGPALTIPIAVRIAQNSGDVTIIHVAVGLGLGVLLGAIMGTFMQFHHAKHDARAATEPVRIDRTSDQRRSPRRPHLPSWFIGALMICSLIPAAQLCRQASAELATRHWESVDATVLDVNVAPESHGRVSCTVDCAWEVDGLMHTGGAFDAGPGHRFDAEVARDLRTTYEAGTEQTIYVDPDRPERAILVPSISSRTMGALIKISIVTVALQMTLAVLLRKTRRNRALVFNSLNQSVTEPA